MIEVLQRLESEFTLPNIVMKNYQYSLESDTFQTKKGDGVTAYNDLPYVIVDLKNLIENNGIEPIDINDTTSSSSSVYSSSKIDTITVTLQDSITTNADDIAILTSDLSGLTTAVGTNTTNIATLTTNVTTITTNLNTLAGRVTTVEADIVSINGDLSTLSSSISGFQTSITAIESDIITIEGNITTLQGNITTLTSYNTTQYTRMTNIEGSVTALDGRIDTLESSQATQDTTITNIQSSISTIESDISTIEGNITTIQANVSTNTSDISALQTQVSGLNLGLVGTKVVNETNIGDGKALVYNATNGELEYQLITGGGGGSSIDDITPSLTTTYSSTKIEDLILNSLGSGSGGTAITSTTLTSNQTYNIPTALLKIYESSSIDYVFSDGFTEQNLGNLVMTGGAEITDPDDGTKKIIQVTTTETAIPTSSTLLTWTEDFTISMWFKPSSLVAFGVLCGFGGNANNYSSMLITTESGAINFYGTVSSGWQYNGVTLSPPTLTAGTWTHITIEKLGQTLNCYINGALSGSSDLSLYGGQFISNGYNLVFGSTSWIQTANYDDIIVTSGSFGNTLYSARNTLPTVGYTIADYNGYIETLKVDNTTDFKNISNSTKNYKFVVSAIGAGLINDTTPSTSTTYSSTKIEDLVGGAGASIDDNNISISTTYSSDKINSLLTTINGNITALDSRVTITETGIVDLTNSLNTTVTAFNTALATTNTRIDNLEVAVATQLQGYVQLQSANLSISPLGSQILNNCLFIYAVYERVLQTLSFSKTFHVEPSLYLEQNDVGALQFKRTAGNRAVATTQGNVHYISTGGSDTIGNGTQLSPYRTFGKAVTVAVTGDTIYFMSGRHTVAPYKHTTNTASCLYDLNKQLLITGDDSAVCVCSYAGSTLVVRDKNLFYFLQSSEVDKLNIEFETIYNTTNYTVAIFGYQSKGVIKNTYIKNTLSTGCFSITYAQASGTTATNCTFDGNGFNIVSSYSGVITYTNCQFSSTHTVFGTYVTCYTGVVSARDLYNDTLTASALKNTGTGTNPDGTVAHIGTAGGTHGWGWWNDTYAVGTETFSDSGNNKVTVTAGATMNYTEDVFLTASSSLKRLYSPDGITWNYVSGGSLVATTLDQINTVGNDYATMKNYLDTKEYATTQDIYMAYSFTNSSTSSTPYIYSVGFEMLGGTVEQLSSTASITRVDGMHIINNTSQGLKNYIVYYTPTI